MRSTLFLTFFIVLNILGEAQEVNKVIFDENASAEILYGSCTVDGFLTSPFNEWYLPEHSAYSPEIAVLEEAKNYMDSVKIRMILGTWCSDSQREVPRFIKMFESADFLLSTIEIICVNRGKTAIEAGVEEGYVEFVPTFIFFRGEAEIGRIVETPSESLEKDMLTILKK